MSGTSASLASANIDPRITYAYVDLACLTEAIKDFQKNLGEPELAFNYDLFVANLEAHRTFFYDAYPSQKKKQTNDEFKSIFLQKEELFETLNRIDGAHVRTGQTTGSTEGMQRQKGVDTYLAVDAVAHAYERVCDFATFVVSDLDFFPVLERLTHTRVRTTLYYRPDATSRELIGRADTTRQLSHSLLLNCCDESIRKKHVVIRQASDRPDTSNLQVSRSTVRNSEVLFWKENDGRFAVYYQGCISYGKTKQLVLTSRFGDIPIKFQS